MNRTGNELFYKFIEDNKNTDVYKLLLKGENEEGLSRSEIEYAVVQIKSREKTKQKLSKFITNSRFLFPTLLSAEQATHQEVAQYHADLIGSGKKVLDMTAGLGIDAMTFAMNNNTVTAIDYEERKIEILKHNCGVLHIDIDAIHANSIDLAKNGSLKNYDVLFIDPARRDCLLNRTFALKDCQPDVVENFKLLKEIAPKIIIKCSPMLDVTQVLKEMPETTELHLICYKGECKEILLIHDSQNYNVKETERPITFLKVIEIISSRVRKEWVFTNEDFGTSKQYVSLENIKPGTYIYDPNAGMHKLNLGAKLCTIFPGMKKVSPNTELYWSKEYYDQFPGRKFLINDTLNKVELKKLKGNSRDVIVRNYPVSAENLFKKLKLKSSDKGLFLIGMGLEHLKTNLIADCNQIFGS